MIARAAEYRERILAFLLLFVVIAALWFAAAWPVVRMLAKPSEDVARSVKLLSSYRAAAAERPGLEQTLRKLRTRGSTAPGLVQGDSATLAAAQMQSEIKALVEGARGSIHSSQNLAAKANGNYEEIALSYALSAPADQLLEVLYALESHVPHYALSDVHIWVPENSSSTVVTPELQFTVTALRWSGAK